MNLIAIATEMPRVHKISDKTGLLKKFGNLVDDLKGDLPSGIDADLLAVKFKESIVFQSKSLPLSWLVDNYQLLIKNSYNADKINQERAKAYAKVRTINLNVNKEDYSYLQIHAKKLGISVNKLLQDFIKDVTSAEDRQLTSINLATKWLEYQKLL